MEQQPETQAGAGSSFSNQADLSQREAVVLSQGRGGIVGIKAGMTQVFNEQGDALAVTVIDLRPAVITQLKTKETDGYQAVQVGILPKKAHRANRAEKGRMKNLGDIGGFYHYQEFRLADKATTANLTAGKILSAEFIKPGDFVDITSISKGKGFQGGMKRFHMAGGYKSHGASVNHRQIGSIGNRADPGRCFKNKKMAGHMGHERVTVQNVRVIRVDWENRLLLVNGSVPGPRSSVVTVRLAVKKVG